MGDPAPGPMTPSSGFLVEPAVDQSGHRPHPRRVALAAVAVHGTQRLVAAEPADGVLHLDPPPREGAVVAPVLRRPLPPARLAPRRRPAQPLNQPVDADVGQVAQRPHARPRQPPGQAGAAEDLQVGPRPRPALADIDDPAVLIDGHLALERVRLLLAGVVGTLPPP